MSALTSLSARPLSGGPCAARTKEDLQELPSIAQPLPSKKATRDQPVRGRAQHLAKHSATVAVPEGNVEQTIAILVRKAHQELAKHLATVAVRKGNIGPITTGFSANRTYCKFPKPHLLR